MESLKERALRALRWSERYTKTDMVYLFAGSFWLVFEQAAGALFALALATVFGHYASQDTYGNYKYALSLMAILSAFSLSGLGTAITQAAARGKEGSLSQGFRLNLQWSGGMVAIGLAASLYYFFRGNAFLAIALCFIAFTAPLLTGFSLYDSFLVGQREFKRNAIYTVLTNALPAIAVMLALFFVGKRAIYLVIAYVAVSLCANGYFYLKSAKSAANSETDDGMFSYGFHLSVVGVTAAIADKIDSIAVFALLGPTQLAVYAYAIAMPEQIKGVTKNIIPLSIAGFAQRSSADIRHAMKRRLLFLAAGLLLVIALYVATAPFLFKLLFPLYAQSVRYSQLFSLSLILTVTTPFAAFFQAHKKMREIYVSSYIGSVALIVGLPMFTYFYGIGGTIASIMLYRVLNAILISYLFFKASD